MKNTVDKSQKVCYYIYNERETQLREFPTAEFTWSGVSLRCELIKAERKVSPMEESLIQQCEAGGLAEWLD